METPRTTRTRTRPSWPPKFASWSRSTERRYGAGKRSMCSIGGADRGSAVVQPPEKKGTFGLARCEVNRTSGGARRGGGSSKTSTKVGPERVDEVVVVYIEVVAD